MIHSLGWGWEWTYDSNRVHHPETIQTVIYPMYHPENQKFCSKMTTDTESEVCVWLSYIPGASFSKNLKSTSDLKHGNDNGCNFRNFIPETGLIMPRQRILVIQSAICTVAGTVGMVLMFNPVGILTLITCIMYLQSPTCTCTSQNKSSVWATSYSLLQYAHIKSDRPRVV